MSAAADIVLPSVFATEDLGERYTPYSLKAQMIPAFLENSSPISTIPGFGRRKPNVSQERPWSPLTNDLVGELRRRSADRLLENEEFIEINEQLAKFAEEDDVIHLAELIREREEAETEDSEGVADREKAEKAATDAAEEAAPGPKKASSEQSKKLEESATPKADDEEEDEPTPQRMEALRILADLVELQETTRTSWHAPQSASRSESPASR